MAPRKQSPRELKRQIMRGALTRATSKLTVSGRPRGGAGDSVPRPVTLPKMPWDDEKKGKL